MEFQRMKGCFVDRWTYSGSRCKVASGQTFI